MDEYYIDFVGINNNFFINITKYPYSETGVDDDANIMAMCIELNKRWGIDKAYFDINKYNREIVKTLTVHIDKFRPDIVIDIVNAFIDNTDLSSNLYRYANNVECSIATVRDNLKKFKSKFAKELKEIELGVLEKL